MAGDFRIRVESAVVHVIETGTLDYPTSNRALVGAIEAARASGTKRLLFDLRDADLSDFYSYIVRHAETATEMGLDASYSLAILGRPERADVLSFVETVARNRGWRAMSFFALDAALEWLASDAG